ncbi:MAG: hypothetical protein MUC36_12490 [Planctomycetes bacterium]|jgi:hypothetical protein|nr:hypothetical protein [Planctomycetota bacterium]
MPDLLLRAALCAAVVTATAAAQDQVSLQSVTVLANGDVTVVYGKNFATCAHLRLSNANCTQNGPLVHFANVFCTQGTQVTVTLPSTAFTAAFGPGVSVYMVHGNNSNVASPCVSVGCDGSYGSGCAGGPGVPVLSANSDCPPSGSTLDLGIGNGLPGSIAVLGFGIGQTSLPVLGCQLLLGSVLGTAAVPFDAAGAGTFPFPLPLGSGGVQFTVQAFAIDAAGPQGFSATNGRLVRVL